MSPDPAIKIVIASRSLACHCEAKPKQSRLLLGINSAILPFAKRLPRTLWVLAMTDKIRRYIIPWAIEALKSFQQKYLLFIVTNQSGIGKNIFSKVQYLKFNKHFIRLLNSSGVAIKHAYYCPHRKEEGCICRKPLWIMSKRSLPNGNFIR